MATSIECATTKISLDSLFLPKRRARVPQIVQGPVHPGDQRTQNQMLYVHVDRWSRGGIVAQALAGPTSRRTLGSCYASRQAFRDLWRALRKRPIWYFVRARQGARQIPNPV